MKEAQNKKVTLDYGKDFTTVALVKFLNEKYGQKKTGKPFTLSDIQQYLRRGHLPRPYGFHPITLTYIQEIGINVISVDFETTLK